MKLKLKPSSGMRDVLPQDYQERNYLKSIIEQVFEKRGFTGIDTPILEDLTGLVGQGGQENEKLMYRVLKRGQNLVRALDSDGELADLGLRFDLTVPLCRYFANNRAHLEMPFKRFHIANVFRAERPARGRFREFYQCDVDIIGSHSSLVEIEVMLAVHASLKQLGFSGFKIHLNSRPFLQDLLCFFNIPEMSRSTLLILLDKMDKMPAEKLHEQVKFLLEGSSQNENSEPDNLKPVMEDNYINAFLSFLSETRDLDETERFAHAEKIIGNSQKLDSIDSLRSLEKLIMELEIPVCIDPFLVRGMGYYTGAIFEIKDEKESFALAGGGRYDELIGRFLGKSIPACGFSIGFERILTLMKERGLFPDFHQKVDFYILRMDESLDSDYLQLTEKLRQRGLCIELALERKKINKQLATALKKGSGYAVFLGPDEKSNGVIKVKNLTEKTEWVGNINEFIHWAGERSTKP